MLIHVQLNHKSRQFLRSKSTFSKTKIAPELKPRQNAYLLKGQVWSEFQGIPTCAIGDSVLTLLVLLKHEDFVLNISPIAHVGPLFLLRFWTGNYENCPPTKFPLGSNPSSCDRGLRLFQHFLPILWQIPSIFHMSEKQKHKTNPIEFSDWNLNTLFVARTLTLLRKNAC